MGFATGTTGLPLQSMIDWDFSDEACDQFPQRCDVEAGYQPTEPVAVKHWGLMGIRGFALQCQKFTEFLPRMCAASPTGKAKLWSPLQQAPSNVPPLSRDVSMA